LKNSSDWSIRLSGDSAVPARLGRDLASLREEDPGGGAGVVADAVEVAWTGDVLALRLSEKAKELGAACELRVEGRHVTLPRAARKRFNTSWER